MKTAVDYIIEQLWAPCRGIPSHIIEEAKRLEKDQLYHSFYAGGGVTSIQDYFEQFTEYYNQTYNQNK